MVPAGETHAIVGATGSGKSSLLRLILRFDDPRWETSFSTGAPVRDLDWDSLRGSMGYVAQDVYMFAGTIADNIAYGRPGASRGGHGAAEAAAALDFIEALPDGLDTLGGRAGRDALRRAAAAPRLARRCCATPPCSSSTRRRAPSTTRRRPRSRGPCADRDGPVHDDRGGPPVVDRPPRAPDLGARRRPDHRGRDARRAGRPRRCVRRPRRVQTGEAKSSLTIVRLAQGLALPYDLGAWLCPATGSRSAIATTRWSGASLGLVAGRVAALVDPNGSGKSTLLFFTTMY